MFIYIYNSGTAYSLEFPCPQDFRWEVMESDKKYREVALYMPSSISEHVVHAYMSLMVINNSRGGV